jgi:hypothetical protein
MSPLESPLHTAMPADDPDGFDAVFAAVAAAEQGAGAQLAGVSAAAGRLPAQQSGLQLGIGQSDPPTSPLGSPLRHGLTSPAALYRLQQQQLHREASTAGSEAAAITHSGRQQHQQLQKHYSGVDAAAGFELSEHELTLKPQQLAMVHAAADLAGFGPYDGSMSPTKLAKIQEYARAYNLSSVDLGAGLSPAALRAKAAAGAAGVGGGAAAGGTPEKGGEGFDSFNLNNQALQADLEQQQHDLQQRDQCEVQQQEQHDGVQQSRLHQQQHQQHAAVLPALSAEPSRESMAGRASVRASIEALLAAKLRASNSSSRPGSAGSCEEAVAQLLSRKQQQPHSHLGAEASWGEAQQLNVEAEHHHHHQQQQQLRREASGSSSGSHSRHHSSSTGGHTQQQQAAAATASSLAASVSSSAPSACTAALMQVLAGARNSHSLSSSSLLASVHQMLEMPALLAASAETLDIQPSETGQASWQQQQGLGSAEGSRLSQDSQQDAVMQSHGALLGPGPGFNSFCDPAAAAAAGSESGDDGGAFASCGAAAGEVERRSVQHGAATAAATGVRPPAAAADFRRSFHLLAGLAQELWPNDARSIDSTAGSNVVGAMSHGAAAVSWARGGSGAAGLRCSTGSLGPEVELAHQLAASMEHLAASLDITGPQVG